MKPNYFSPTLSISGDAICRTYKLYHSVKNKIHKNTTYMTFLCWPATLSHVLAYVPHFAICYLIKISKCVSEQNLRANLNENSEWKFGRHKKIPCTISTGAFKQSTVGDKFEITHCAFMRHCVSWEIADKQINGAQAEGKEERTIIVVRSSICDHLKHKFRVNYVSAHLCNDSSSVQIISIAFDFVWFFVSVEKILFFS